MRSSHCDSNGDESDGGVDRRENENEILSQSDGASGDENAETRPPQKKNSFSIYSLHKIT